METSLSSRTAEAVFHNQVASVDSDLDAMTVTYDNTTIDVTLRDDQRKAFLEGTWDALNLLKANMERVRETAAQLPHMSL